MRLLHLLEPEELLGRSGLKDYRILAVHERRYVGDCRPIRAGQ